MGTTSLEISEGLKPTQLCRGRPTLQDRLFFKSSGRCVLLVRTVFSLPLPLTESNVLRLHKGGSSYECTDVPVRRCQQLAERPAASNVKFSVWVQTEDQEYREKASVFSVRLQIGCRHSNLDLANRIRRKHR